MPVSAKCIGIIQWSTIPAKGNPIVSHLFHSGGELRRNWKVYLILGK